MEITPGLSSVNDQEHDSDIPNDNDRGSRNRTVCCKWVFNSNNKFTVALEKREKKRIWLPEHLQRGHD